MRCEAIEADYGVKMKDNTNFQCLLTFFIAKHLSIATGVLEQGINQQIHKLYKRGFVLSYQDRTNKSSSLGRMVLLAPPVFWDEFIPAKHLATLLLSKSLLSKNEQIYLNQLLPTHRIKNQIPLYNQTVGDSSELCNILARSRLNLACYAGTFPSSAKVGKFKEEFDTTTSIKLSKKKKEKRREQG